MTDELIDIYDKNNKPLGTKKSIAEIHKDGSWHRSAHVWIYNHQGQVLLQLRAKNKRLFPFMWDISAAGHTDSGEDPLSTALRETKEEIGLTVLADDLDFFKIKKYQIVYKKIKNNEFCYIYFLRFDGKADNLKLQKEELESVRFLSIKKIKKELSDNSKRYVPHGDYWFEIIKEVQRKTGE